MKKELEVYQLHCSSKKKYRMYKGTIVIDKLFQQVSFSYIEEGTKAKVYIEANKDTLNIKREAEMTTTLIFKNSLLTLGNVNNEFGDLEIFIFTHKYHCTENIIVVEYDILNSKDTNDVNETYRIMWKIKETNDE
ncbi:MAG: DUF1934 family protein [Erysipelotrichaceae bacterium]